MNTCKLIDGKELSSQLRKQIANEVSRLRFKPGLAVVLVGDNPASISYVKGKEKACAEVGINTRQLNFKESVSEEELIECINMLNTDPTIHGILVQLPLPDHISTQRIVQQISIDKDVDGFTPENVGKMVLGEDCFLPCTPHGILKLLEFGKIDVAGKHVVVVGRSNIVGKPVAMLLSKKECNATVTICHTGTPDISKFTKEADIVVVAAGKPNTIVGSMLKDGAVVVDVGVNRIPDSSRPSGFKLVGDADFDSCKEIASAITPVPGGVGPMTITMLLWNTLHAAKSAEDAEKDVEL